MYVCNSVCVRERESPLSLSETSKLDDGRAPNQNSIRRAEAEPPLLRSNNARRRRAALAHDSNFGRRQSRGRERDFEQTARIHKTNNERKSIPSAVVEKRTKRMHSERQQVRARWLLTCSSALDRLGPNRIGSDRIVADRSDTSRVQWKRRRRLIYYVSR